MSKYTVAVAGASGYAGGEMLRILAAHPAFEVTTLTGDSSAGEQARSSYAAYSDA